MRNFIEVTRKDSKQKNLIKVSRIFNVAQTDDGTVRIVFLMGKKQKQEYMSVLESFEEVYAKLADCERITLPFIEAKNEKN